MNEEKIRRFPEELGKLGYVFNFITYGGHRVDGMLAPLTDLSRPIEDSANVCTIC